MKKTISLLLVVLVAGCEPSDPKLREPHLAAMACRDGVKGQLKTPNTAVFAMDDGSRRVDDKSIKVESWVDAKNDFGVTVRRHFTCNVSVDAGKVKVEDVSLQN